MCDSSQSGTSHTILLILLKRRSTQSFWFCSSPFTTKRNGKSSSIISRSATYWCRTNYRVFLAGCRQESGPCCRRSSPRFGPVKVCRISPRHRPISSRHCDANVSNDPPAGSHRRINMSLRDGPSDPTLMKTGMSCMVGAPWQGRTACANGTPACTRRQLKDHFGVWRVLPQIRQTQHVSCGFLKY